MSAGDYLDWQSSISLEDVFSQAQPFSYPSLKNDRVYYLSSLSEEKGRSVIMQANLVNGIAKDVVCITPAQFNLRTRISEYGGKPYCLCESGLIFSNQEDQRLYYQAYGQSSCLAISPKTVAEPALNESRMYADVVELDNRHVISIVETQSAGVIGDSKHSIELIDYRNEPKLIELVNGADFYSNLVLNPEKSKVAWVQWDHPNMPWDETQLYVADLKCPRSESEAWSIDNIKQVSVEKTGSVCQLLFAENDRLFCSIDYQAQNEPRSKPWKNYWNIHLVDTSHGLLSAQPVTKLEQEFGYPHWQYGDARIAQLDNQTLLAFATDKDEDRLYKIDVSSLKVDEVDHDYQYFQSISADGVGKAVFITQQKSKAPTLAVTDGHTISDCLINEKPLKNGEASRKELDKKDLSANDISEGQHFSFPTRDGEQAFAYYYAPKNRQASVEPSKTPPLIVMVHGGPTARAYGFFDLQKQFWTSRGFAIVDVNHRGSSGYGRAYRYALYGRWGDTDCDDIIDAVNYLIAEGKADKKRICIRGKSAGGYAVLRALTEHADYFAAGACYYGIGNLVTLAELTHKFEKHYTDRLIGETFVYDEAIKPESRFYQRSPINKVSQLKSAMIIFQGLKDKVVPPELAHEVVAVLKEMGIRHEYVEYADEAHGFRQKQTNIDAWSKELAFYREVLEE